MKLENNLYDFFVIFLFPCFVLLRLASLRLPFLCAECGKRYRNERSLHIHQQIHTKATIQCTECPGKFYRHTFKAHYEMHKNLKYKCNECNVTCANRSSLGKHIRKLNLSNT